MTKTLHRNRFYKTLVLICLMLNAQCVFAQMLNAQCMKPGARWWWLGSAVDTVNLRWTMQQYASHGIGALEITPIYGVQGNDANNIPYLSDKWMEMLRFVEKEAARDSIEVDMATGTGWPFGGPWVPIDEAACKAVFVDTILEGRKMKNIDLSAPEKEQKFARLDRVVAFSQGAERQAVDVTNYMVDAHLTWTAPKIKNNSTWRIIALYVSRTRQKVKRAAPGGEGWVIDHFDRDAVKHYLQHFDEAFSRTSTPYPHTFFNDSYEVYGANWTPQLPTAFLQRRGYSLCDNLDRLCDGDTRVVSDYRETLSDLLLENFTEQWTAWAHSHGAITRNQAHGSPANLIDCYAAVDIPEIEGFGLSEFHIKGLRTDSGMTRRNDSDLSMLKYAPSAAHIMGKPYTSSETFTWLTEHFRTSLSQLKPDLDLMFCAGVNHVYFHGTTYSPKDDPWPGWKFYASIDMSPTNTIWRDAPSLMKYIERCQGYLQWGQPDNDFLVYLPVRDMWQRDTKNLLMQFDIHNMKRRAPEFISAVLRIDSLGFDCDYISEKHLMATVFKDGMLQTEGGTRYKGLIIPGKNIITPTLQAHIDDLKRQGARIIQGTDEQQMVAAARPETMKTRHGVKVIRRRHEEGYHYFIANLTPNDIDSPISLGVDCANALWHNPMNGQTSAAEWQGQKLQLRLRSGESRILETFDQAPAGMTSPAEVQPLPTKTAITLTAPWTLSFTESVPEISKTYTLEAPKTWENIDDATRILRGTGVYETTLTLNKKDLSGAAAWQIDLGDVRESARVYINNVYVGCAWAVPFVLNFDTSLLHKGKNTLRIEVTNLPANSIADLDRRQVPWRKMNEINVVNINYKKTTYADWAPVASGLNSEVKLYRIEKQ